MGYRTNDKARRNTSESFRGICMNILLLCTLLIGLFLTYYSLHYSYYSSVNYNRPVYRIQDNVCMNLLLCLGVIVLVIPLNHLFQKLGDKQRIAGYLFLGGSCLLYAVICLVWVSELPYYPDGDQLSVTAAAYYNLDGNFSMLQPTGYLGKFPYQKGVTFLYEILFSLFRYSFYSAAARLHILFGVATMIFGYLFVEETSAHSICKMLYCPLMLFCIPYLILTPYTYGDLPSICFCTVLFWALLRFARTGQWRYAILGCVMASWSLLMRMHTWIVLIAIVIAMLLAALQKKALRPILAAVLILSGALGSVKLLDYVYELRSGYEATSGAPMILTLAMGMQDNDNGPGTYNNYQTSTLSSVDFDIEAAKGIALENLRENLDHFAEDSSYANWFFSTKLQMQWIEPTFETLISTHSFDEDKSVPEWIEKVYSGSWHDPLIKFADRYQSIVYVGFLLFVPVLWRRRRENIAGFLPLISIVGGFLFSILWEAQCRYVLPYYLFMLLYVPDGIYFAGEAIAETVRKLRNRYKPQAHKDV